MQFIIRIRLHIDLLDVSKGVCFGAPVDDGIPCTYGHLVVHRAFIRYKTIPSTALLHF